MNHFPVLLLRNLHAPCASQARACVLCAKLLRCCCPRTWPARDPGTMQTLSSHFTLHSSHPTLHTSHLHFISSSSHLSSSQYSFHVCPICQLSSSWLFSCQVLPSTDCLLTKLAKTTSQYYIVLQSLHKTRSSITLYYKACSTSQYYFVLQSLQKQSSTGK